MANLVDNKPGDKLYTQQELAAFINASPSNLISFCCVRNPSTVYAWILRNYPMFGRLGNLGWTTPIGQDNMHDFLLTEYGILSAPEQKEFLAHLGASLPDDPEVDSWATPKN